MLQWPTRMDESSASDRRHEVRAPIELKVEYKRLNTFFADYTRNISRGGTFIRTTKPLPIGTEFLFKLFVPHLGDALRVQGEVQWIVTEQDVVEGKHPEPGMGIRFTYRQGSTPEEIDRVVERLMVDSLGQRLYSKLMDQSRDKPGSG